MVCASARAATVWNSTILLSILAICPQPTAPTCNTSDAIHDNNGDALSKCACSPPTIIASVPVSAAARVRATGESINSNPRFRASFASVRVSDTEVVEQSMIKLPVAAWLNTPPSPVSTASTSLPPGNDIRMILLCCDNSATDSAAIAPADTTDCKRSASRSKTLRTLSFAAPLSRRLHRFRHIGSPMTPSPIKPTRRLSKPLTSGDA